MAGGGGGGGGAGGGNRWRRRSHRRDSSTPQWLMEIDPMGNGGAGFGNGWRDRQGGINPRLLNQLNGDDKEFARQHGFGRNKLWEQAAWEMGIGNLDNVDEVRRLFDAFRKEGIQSFDSQADVAGFRKYANGGGGGTPGQGRRTDEELQELFSGWMDERQKAHEPQRIPGSEGYGDLPPWLGSMLGSMSGGHNGYGINPYVQQQNSGWSPSGGW